MKCPGYEINIYLWQECDNKRERKQETDIKTFDLQSNQVFCSPQHCNALPSILQFSCANCPEQVAPELASCNYSILTNLLISIFSWQIFGDKNTAKQYLVAWQNFYQRKSARNINGNVAILGGNRTPDLTVTPIRLLIWRQINTCHAIISSPTITASFNNSIKGL